ELVGDDAPLVARRPQVHRPVRLEARALAALAVPRGRAGEDPDEEEAVEGRREPARGGVEGARLGRRAGELGGVRAAVAGAAALAAELRRADAPDHLEPGLEPARRARAGEGAGEVGELVVVERARAAAAVVGEELVGREG